MRRAAAVCAGLVLVCGGVAAAAWWRCNVPGPLAAAMAVTVPKGGLDEVGQALQEHGVVRSSTLFRLAAAVTWPQGPLHAAELQFPAQASLRIVLAILRTGRPVQHRLTIPEGFTALQVVALLAHAEGLTGEVATPPEGGILPETYSYERGATREQVLDRGRSAMARMLDAAWAVRAPSLALTTPQEALILASLVERETARAEERPIVAAVFLNRLRLGMKLQSDPTVVYGASGGMGSLDHGITRVELEHADGYNTYQRNGLPVTPICMPGVASLQAATHPADTDALYFVADGSGGHAFARTQGEHLEHVAHWREIERARGH